MAPTIEVLSASLALAMAVLTAHAMPTAASASAARTSHGVPCRALAGSLTLGLGVFAVIYLQALSLNVTDWSTFNLASLLLPVVITFGAQLSSMLFIESQAGPASLAAGSVSVAAGVVATQWTIFAAQPGRLATAVTWPWIGGCAVCVTAGVIARQLPTAARLPRCLPPAAVHAAGLALIATGMLVPLAQATARGSVPVDTCCSESSTVIRLLSVTVTVICAASLLVLLLTRAHRGRLEIRSRRSAIEISELRGRLQHAATHDGLTGLPNRQLFKERLTRALAEEVPGRSIAVLQVNLDSFCYINQSLGHAAGDQVLAAVASRLQAHVPAPHMVARVAGDEFAALIVDTVARVEAHAIARTIEFALAAPMVVNTTEVQIQPSIGVSVWPDDARRADDLLVHAEAAMRAARDSGVRKTLFFEPGMSDSMQQRLALENELRRAIAEEQFELHYQPQLSVKTGTVVSVEALLRWRHPVKGIIGPGAFISLAEQTGLIVPIGRWVFQEACRQAKKWESETGQQLRVAVNVSAIQVHPMMLEDVRSALALANLNPKLLEVELTESAAMGNSEECTGLLRDLRRLGVTVAIDDFGTGYSSLSYLRHLPIDKLKIDRSFIRDMVLSATARSIVRAIILLAQSVGLQVVAEGVETAEQLDAIRSLDCDYWQGYYCCQPLQASQLQKLLAERVVSRTGLVSVIGRTLRGSGDTK